MWEVIWEWRFPDPKKREKDKNTQIAVLKKNVKSLPTFSNFENYMDDNSWTKDIAKLQKIIHKKIDLIILNGIEDYFFENDIKSTKKNIKKYRRKTKGIRKEIRMKAEAMREAIFHVEDEDMGLYFSEAYVVNSVTGLLSDYEDKVVNLLSARKNK